MATLQRTEHGPGEPKVGRSMGQRRRTHCRRTYHMEHLLIQVFWSTGLPELHGATERLQGVVHLPLLSQYTRQHRRLLTARAWPRSSCRCASMEETSESVTLVVRACPLEFLQVSPVAVPEAGRDRGRDRGGQRLLYTLLVKFLLIQI